MIVWNDPEYLAKLSRFVPYIFIGLGFIVAVFGQFAKSKIESRIVDLRNAEQIAIKHTRPLVDVSLGKSDRTGKILLVIIAGNQIPFKTSWHVVTENNMVVSGILLEKPEVFPTEEKKRFLQEVIINDDKVVNNYIELRFSFESIYYAELNNPEHLKGNLVKKYRYVEGYIFPWEKTANN